MKKALLATLIGLSLCTTTEAAFKVENYPMVMHEVVNSTEKIRIVNTVDMKIPFTFGGFTNKQSLQNILDVMNKNNWKGTFFVTTRELDKNANNIKMINDYQQDFGIGIVPVANSTVQDYVNIILSEQKYLKATYGQNVNVVKQMYSADDLNLNKAIDYLNSIGYNFKLIGSNFNVVQSKHKDVVDADTIFNDLFNKWRTSLNRGEIVYFRTDFYKDNNLAANLLEKIVRNKVKNIAYHTFTEKEKTYQITTLEDAMENTYKVGTEVEAVPEDKTNFEKWFLERYIGAPTVNNNERLMGFSDSMIGKMDKSGIVKNVPDKTIFLTFDDFGNDESIAKIMYVLKKHNVAGTFFIITRTVDNNPNIVRALVENGNEIGSHTHEHIPAVINDGKGHSTENTNYEKALDDMIKSKAKLEKYLDGMQVNNRPALTNMMRFPTLAVSYDAAKALYDSGKIDYIVSGNISSEDYGAVSLQSLVSIIDRGIHDHNYYGNGIEKDEYGKNHGKKNNDVLTGSIIIMHMSQNATKTARALDIILTRNELKDDNDPSKFKVALLGDYLKDGYKQR